MRCSTVYAQLFLCLLVTIVGVVQVAGTSLDVRNNDGGHVCRNNDCGTPTPAPVDPCDKCSPGQKCCPDAFDKNSATCCAAEDTCHYGTCVHPPTDPCEKCTSGQTCCHDAFDAKVANCCAAGDTCHFGSCITPPPNPCDKCPPGVTCCPDYYDKSQATCCASGNDYCHYGHCVPGVCKKCASDEGCCVDGLDPNVAVCCKLPTLCESYQAVCKPI